MIPIGFGIIIIILNIIKSDKYPDIPDAHFENRLIAPGTVSFNAGHIWDVDNTDPKSITKALIKGRRIAVAFRDALAEFYPRVFGNAYLVVTGSLLGIRESRRIVGDYRLTIDDYLARRSFHDEICRNSYFVDIHTSKTEIQKDRKGALDIGKRFERYGKGESHGVPYKCLTPKALKNVIVAGRSISCDRIVQGSIRVTPVCLAMGEAAGMAAAHAVKYTENDIHAVNVKRLRQRLKEEGAYLPDLVNMKG